MLEDIGDRLAFEVPYWAGEHDDYDGAYAVPFHPGELCEDALAELFGFRAEGGPVPDSAPVDQDAVVLNGFRLGDIGSAGAGYAHLAHTENCAAWPDPAPDRLRQLVADLGPGNRYLVYQWHRDFSVDPDLAFYIQTYRHVDAGFCDVEFRAGTAEQHYATTMDTADEVARALSAWAARDMDWTADRTWTTPFA